MHTTMHATPLVSLASHWATLGAISVNDGGHLEEPFLHFEAGTPQEAIWAWFEAQNPAFDVEDAQEGDLVEDIQKIQQLLALFRWANLVMVDNGDHLVTQWHCIQDHQISGNPNACVANLKMSDGDWTEVTEWAAKTASIDLEDKAVWTSTSDGEGLQLRFYRLEAVSLDSVLSHPEEPLLLKHATGPVPDLQDASIREGLRNGVIGARRLG